MKKVVQKILDEKVNMSPGLKNKKTEIICTNVDQRKMSVTISVKIIPKSKYNILDANAIKALEMLLKKELCFNDLKVQF